jgi:hypothetical protein
MAIARLREVVGAAVDVWRALLICLLFEEKFCWKECCHGDGAEGPGPLFGNP